MLKFLRDSCIILIISLSLLGFLEGSIAFLLNHPEWIPKHNVIHKAIKAIYLNEQRVVIQTEPQFAVYHPRVGYTLKPGEFTFSNIEFETDYHVNSEGLRDDEASLNQPRVVVLGDSWSMGWGVDQEETYAQVLEKLSGRVVLNAGISSYGTVRELMTLERLNLSNSPEFLIIHYCDNDIVENQTFLEEQNLNISDPEVFREKYEDYRNQRRYYPFKYMVKFMRYLGYFVLKEPDKKLEGEANHAEIFMEVLDAFADRWSKEIKLIVIGPRNFIADLVEVKVEHAAYSFHALIDQEELLGEESFFILDDHPNAEGHRRIAQKLFALT